MPVEGHSKESNKRNKVNDKETLNDPVNGIIDPVNDPVKGRNDLVKNLAAIYNVVTITPEATYSEIAQKLNISIATVKRNIQKLK